MMEPKRLQDVTMVQNIIFFVSAESKRLKAHHLKCGESIHAISYTEMKSHRIWPIWKPIPIGFFWSHMFIISFIHWNTGFWQFWGSFKVIFKKILTEF